MGLSFEGYGAGKFTVINSLRGAIREKPRMQPISGCPHLKNSAWFLSWTRQYITEILKGGFIMPKYEFLCQKCNKKYSLAMTVKDREEGKFKCPKCGSRKNQPLFGNFYAKTSKKS